MFSRHHVAFFAVIFLLAGSVSLAAEPSNLIALGPEPMAGKTSVAQTESSGSGMTLQFRAPYLEIYDQEKNGEVFQLINMPGEQSDGREGQPALPLVTRLVAVPDGMTLQVVKIENRNTPVAGKYRPWPAQGIRPATDQSLSLDTQYYQANKQNATPGLVTVGQPGLVRGLRVVPVRFRPVRWTAVDGTLEVAAEIDVTFDLVASSDGNRNRNDGRPIPESFAKMFASEVIGYQEKAGTMGVYGSYLIIHPDNATVLSNLQPLIQWRQRQGYNVVVASTAETGTSTTSIKSYIQSQYNELKNSLEFVTLVGDANGSVAIPTYTEYLSGYNGEGDHEYTLLDGSDLLADVHLGRLSVDSASMLATVVNKIVNYESNPHLSDDTEWFTRAGLTGDPGTSGDSCIYVNQWVKQQLMELKYSRVDTIWSGNFSSLMMETVSRGESFFTYRGYYGMSGLHEGFISAMNNGQKLPFALILTCDTGSFESDANCRSEAFFRASNGGAVAAIGTATIGTHTRYNNCMFQGVAEGILNRDDPRAGPALTLGKLNLFENYYDVEPNKVSIWSTWNSLIGDPATAIWTAVPTTLTVDYPSDIAVGANSLPVTITAGGFPQAGALVTVFRAGLTQVSAVTGDDGKVILPLSNLIDGEYLVTVTGKNLKPYLGGVNVGDLVASVNYFAVVVDDDNVGSSSGNNDGLANPGETVELSLQLVNNGTGGVSDITADIGTGDTRVAVTQPTASFGYIATGATATGAANYVVTLDPAIAGGSNLPLELVATDGFESWTSVVDLEVSGAAAETYLVALRSSTINPGETSILDVTLRNVGNLATAGATGTLTSSSRWLSVTDGDGTFGSMTAGGWNTNASNTFIVEAGIECFPGHVVALTLDLVFAEGGTASVPVFVTVGNVQSTDPTGPDRHGYYAFDDTDVGYPLAPIYDWVEISPDNGGAGTSVGLSDFGRWQDDVVVMDLPFPFTYYGEAYTKMSVCTNGWISMGGTDLRHYRNWTLPSPGTPDNMIAVYWDDLYEQASNSGVYYWHDVANHRLIIEWDNVANAVSGVPETFQVILHDPAHDAGDTGDGVITMNYQSVTPTDAETGYATVGIQNEDRDDAVLYTYFNKYPAGAAQLTAPRSITFRTVVPQAQGTIEGVVTMAGSGVPIDGATVSVLGVGRNMISLSDGSYATGVSIGVYDVAVHHPSFAPDTTFGVVVAEDVVEVVNFELVDVAGPQFAMQVMPESTGDTAGPYDVVFDVSDHSGIQETHFYYTSSSTGGPFELTPVAEGAPDTWRASIPGQASGTTIQYWLTSTDQMTFTTTEPVGAPFAVHSFVVSQTVEVYASEMESAADWTVGSAQDDASSGLWTNVDPNGVFNGQVEISPEDDFNNPGTMCWITGQDAPGGNQGANDVDGGTTTLNSPVFDITALSGLEVQYRRWYSNDTGNAPNQDDWVVQAQDNTGSWVDLENTTASDRSWQLRQFVLADYLTLGSNLQFRFVASDVGSGSVVEAGVDDFVLTSFAQAVDAAGPVVNLTSPNGGEALEGGAVVPVLWSHSDDIGVVHVEIWLSTDSGGSYAEMIGPGALNGSFDWTVPTVDSATNRIKVICHDAVGNMTEASSATDFSTSTVSAVGDLPINQLAMAQNSPNPFNPRTKITFSLPARQDVRLRVYSVEGRLVRTLITGSKDAGTHTVMWQGDNDQGGQVASGLYFYRLGTSSGTLTRKMTLLK